MLTRVRRSRLEKGLTLAVAAAKVGVGAHVLAQVETGRLRPWPALRARLARIYGAQETELFKDIDAAQLYLREIAGGGRN